MQIFSHPYTRDTGRLKILLQKQKNKYLLEIQTQQDAPEILYRLAAVLFIHGWNIIDADIQTLANKQVKDSFLIKPLKSGKSIDELQFEKLLSDFESLLFERPSVTNYVLENGKTFGDQPFKELDIKAVEQGIGLALEGGDEPGLLLNICRLFVLLKLNIINARIHTDESGIIHNNISFETNKTQAELMETVNELRNGTGTG